MKLTATNTNWVVLNGYLTLVVNK